VLRELLATERDYVADLRALVEVYQRPLSRRIGTRQEVTFCLSIVVIVFVNKRKKNPPIDRL
jgi:hypothetical protein